MMTRTIEQVELHDNANPTSWEAHRVEYYHAGKADSLLCRAMVNKRHKFTACLEMGITKHPSEVSVD